MKTQKVMGPELENLEEIEIILCIKKEEKEELENILNMEKKFFFAGVPGTFELWKVRISRILRSKGLLDTVERLPDDEEYWNSVADELEAARLVRVSRIEKRIEEDNKAVDFIIASLDDEPLNVVKYCKRAKEIFDLLIQTYEKTGPIHLLRLKRRLWDLKYKSFPGLADLFKEHEELIRSIEALGRPIPYEEKVESLLLAIPERYEILNIFLSTSMEDFGKLQLSQIKNMFMTKEESDALRCEMNMDSRSKVQEAAMVSNNFKKRDKSSVKCYGCQKMGHYKYECPEKGKHKKNMFRKDQDKEVACMASGITRVEAILDSGATSHMFRDEKLFSEMEIMDTEKTVTIADGSDIYTKKKGCVPLTSSIGNNKFKRMKLYDVLFLPNFHCNLISVKKLEALGMSILIQSGCVLIHDFSGNLVARGKRIHDLYLLDVYSEICPNEKAFLGQINDKLSSLHKKLGHLGKLNILKLIKHDMAEGLDIEYEHCEKSILCEGCLLGKQTRNPFNDGRFPRSMRVLEVIHSDVCGPFECETFNGFRYFVFFIDDFTHFSHIYLIKYKSEVFSKFKEYEAMVSARFSLKISCLRSDNGGEYCGNDFQDFCKEKGIQLILTIPYNPELNGVSERMNRTLEDKARTMLLESNLDKKFWGEAILTANYLTNRSPTRALMENKTPFEMWFGRKPNLANLVIFGSLAFAHVPKEKRRKLDPRSSKCVFVGYASNGYRLWNPVSRKIILARNVIFDDSFLTIGNSRELTGCQVNDLDDDPMVGQEDSEKLVPSVTQGEVDPSTQIEVLEVVPEVQGNLLNNSLIEPEIEENFQGENLENSENELSDFEGFSDALETLDGTVNSEISMIEQNSGEVSNISKRDRKKPKWHSDYYVELAMVAGQFLDDIPQDIEDLKLRNDWSEWNIAIKDELDSMEENNVWTIIDKIPEGCKAINSKWIFTIKENGMYKARLVAKGCSQKFGFDYIDTFAPVVKMTTIRIMLILANKWNWFIHQMDVKTAFLNGNLGEDLYMKLHVDKIKYCKLNKSIYGLKQASRCWYLKFKSVMERLSFKNLLNDYCLFVSKDKDIFVILYVDDILIFGSTIQNINQFKIKIGKEFRMKDLGEVNVFLGLKITKENGIYRISQKDYIIKVLKRFGMDNANPVKTPMEVDLDLNVESRDIECPYQELIGCLLYLANMTRPDISFAVNKLSRYQNCYKEVHWKSLKRILRYLCGSLDLELVYGNKDDRILIGYADADYANDIIDRKSISGFVFKLFGNIVSWSAKKQDTVAQSSTEAELIALNYGLKEGIWLKNILNEVGIDIKSFVIFEDNVPCIQIAEEPRLHRRIKHIDVKYLLIREYVERNEVTLKHITSRDQLADIFTKALPLITFSRHQEELLKYSK